MKCDECFLQDRSSMYITTCLSDGPPGHEATHMWMEGSVRLYFGFGETHYFAIHKETIAEDSFCCYMNRFNLQQLVCT